MNVQKITVQFKGVPFPPVVANQNQLLKQCFDLYRRGNLKDAHALCIKVLDVNKRNFDALQLMGAIALDTKDYRSSVHFLTLSLEVNPNDPYSFRSRGMAFERHGQLDAAIEDYTRAIELKQDFADTYYNLAVLLARRGDHMQSLLNYDRAIKLNPNLHYIYGSRLMEAMKVCLWDGYEEQLAYLNSKIRSNTRVTPPFAFCVLSDDPQMQRDAASIWARHEYPSNSSLGPLIRRPKQDKIRIGYFSTDFRNHPVSYLTAEMFELQNRDVFEIIAFSLAERVEDAMQNRLRQSFDVFHDVNGMGDMQIAEFSRSQGIDIAVDLGGYTVNNRFGVFSYRAAPIQVGYIGYLGTTGAQYMDYIIADKSIAPPEYQYNCTEKIVYLPCYQVNDSKSKIAEKTGSRAEYGLPPGKFVYCCFNSVYKINPSVFDSWMRILKGSGDSVLFLAPDNPQAEENLKEEAKKRGVDPDRIIYSHHLPRPAFLARFKIADLFLDTWPCNAGTTASESLWSGLPVLTLAGKTFASRIGSSLLTAIGLPELITTSQAQYEDMAIELSRSPARLREITETLSLLKFTSPLFDTKLFTSHLETAYKRMYDQYHSNASLDHIFIDS